MAQPGTGGTVETEAPAVHLLISVIGQGDAVKATIKCKRGTTAAVLKLLASHRDAGPGVLEDKDACSIPESDDMLQPDAGPFKYLLFEGSAEAGAAKTADIAVGGGLQDKTVTIILPNEKTVEVTVGDDKTLEATRKTYGARCLMEDGTLTAITRYSALKPGHVYRAVAYNDEPVVSGKPRAGKAVHIIIKDDDGDEYEVAHLTLCNDSELQMLVNQFGLLYEVELTEDKLKFLGGDAVINLSQVKEGKYYASAYSSKLKETVRRLTVYKDSVVAGGEQAFGKSLCREVQEALPGQDVSPMKHTGQLYKNGVNFAQIDAGAVGPEDAVIGSHKTRLEPRHVEQLDNVIKSVEAHRDDVDELSDLRGKRLHGALCGDSLPDDKDARAAVFKEAGVRGYGVFLPNGSQYSTKALKCRPATPIRILPGSVKAAATLGMGRMARRCMPGACGL